MYHKKILIYVQYRFLTPPPPCRYGLNSDAIAWFSCILPNAWQADVCWEEAESSSWRIPALGQPWRRWSNQIFSFRQYVFSIVFLRFPFFQNVYSPLSSQDEYILYCLFKIHFLHCLLDIHILRPYSHLFSFSYSFTTVSTVFLRYILPLCSSHFLQIYFLPLNPQLFS